jgi:hypothetical protein
MDAPMAPDTVYAIQRTDDGKHDGLRESLKALPLFEI